MPNELINYGSDATDPAASPVAATDEQLLQGIPCGPLDLRLLNGVLRRAFIEAYNAGRVDLLVADVAFKTAICEMVQANFQVNNGVLTMATGCDPATGDPTF